MTVLTPISQAGGDISVDVPLYLGSQEPSSVAIQFDHTAGTFGGIDIVLQGKLMPSASWFEIDRQVGVTVNALVVVADVPYIYRVITENTAAASGLLYDIHIAYA